METLNLDNLPEEAKKKVIQYYEEVLEDLKRGENGKKYKNSLMKKKLKLKEHFSKFDFKPVKFNREEANAR